MGFDSGGSGGGGGAGGGGAGGGGLTADSNVEQITGNRIETDETPVTILDRQTPTVLIGGLAMGMRVGLTAIVDGTPVLDQQDRAGYVTAGGSISGLSLLPRIEANESLRVDMRVIGANPRSLGYMLLVEA